jgi:hypothetical protein
MSAWPQGYRIAGRQIERGIKRVVPFIELAERFFDEAE